MDKQLPKMKAPAEGQITIQQLLQILPDILTPSGAAKLNQKLKDAKTAQPDLDKSIKGIASKVNADHSSRVKNHGVALKKIAQKRLEGRDYGIDDINDALGQRITLNDKKKVPNAIDAIKKAASDGEFKIIKQQHVKTESHDSEHFDIETPGGQRAELQVIPSQQELADSVVNHDIYAQHGEKPPPQVAHLRDTQSDVVKDLSNKKAKKLSKTMLAAHKDNKDLPLPPIQTIDTIAKVAK